MQRPYLPGNTVSFFLWGYFPQYTLAAALAEPRKKLHPVAELGVIPICILCICSVLGAGHTYMLVSLQTLKLF